jgi:hypothetical protein
MSLLYFFVLALVAAAAFSSLLKTCLHSANLSALLRQWSNEV